MFYLQRPPKLRATHKYAQRYGNFYKIQGKSLNNFEDFLTNPLKSITFAEILKQ